MLHAIDWTMGSVVSWQAGVGTMLVAVKPIGITTTPVIGSEPVFVTVSR